LAIFRVALDKSSNSPEDTRLSSAPKPGIFPSINAETSLVIATPEMIGFILVNEDGRTVKWDGKSKLVGAAVQDCENHGLVTAKGILQAIEVPLRQDWTTHYNGERIISLFNQSEIPTEATSHNSFYPREDNSPVLKNRKSFIDVPILPQYRESLPKA
jgi:hypothetical protein